METPGNGTETGRKPRKPRTGKTEDAETPRKVKSSVYLGIETDQRLGVYCSMTRRNRSEVIEWLINEHLRAFVVQRRGPLLTMRGSADPAGEVNDSAATLPIGEAGHPAGDGAEVPSPGAGEGEGPPRPKPARRSA